MATCPSGQGAVCKTVYTGSSPVVASINLSTKTPDLAVAGPGVLATDSL